MDVLFGYWGDCGVVFDAALAKEEKVVLGTSPEGFVKVRSLGDLEYVVESDGEYIRFFAWVVSTDAVNFKVMVGASLLACQ